MGKTIWVLGSQHSIADKSFNWHPAFENFSNSDILIVNLQTLDDEVYQEISHELFSVARRYIADMLMTAEKTVIVIMSSEQARIGWLPIRPLIKQIAPAVLGKNEPTENFIIDYLNRVEECCYYLHDFDVSYMRQLTDPKKLLHENYFFTEEARDAYLLKVAFDERLLNQAKQAIGGPVGCQIFYGLTPTRTYSKSFLSGAIIFLPPTTKVNVKDAIDEMLHSFYESRPVESPPKWEAGISLPGLNDIDKKINQKQKQKNDLINELGNLEKERKDLVRIRRLLWADGTWLENSVKEAFTILGFPEIRKVREKNLEDWVIDFKRVKEFKHGIFEIKGSEKRTSLSDLNQCDKWVKDYLLENNCEVKGIFVPNQYRLGGLKAKLSKREHFEPNELKFARQREICILPSHEIFNAIKEKLKDSTKITRKFLEERITQASGVCKLA